MPVPRLPGFVLQAKIGSGTFSDVYKAYQIVNIGQYMFFLNPDIIIFFLIPFKLFLFRVALNKLLLLNVY